VKGLSVHTTLTYLDGKYKTFLGAFNPDGILVDGSGQPFQDPKWRYSIGARYERPVGPGMLGGSLDWSWRDHNNLTVINISPSFDLGLQKKLNEAVGLLDGRIDYAMPEHGLTMAVFATNLLDKHYQTEALFSAALGIATATTQAPHMFGMTITKTFGE
jgi:iron complex outermembrane receptor protein